MSNSKEITVSKIAIYKNLLIYDNTFFQISNITSVSVSEIEGSLNLKEVLFPIVWTIASSILFFAYSNNYKFSEMINNIIGNYPKFYIWIALVFLGLFTLSFAGVVIDHILDAFKTKTFLDIELSSGSRLLFYSSDKPFIKQAVASLMNSIDEKIDENKKIIFNFDNKTINIESVNSSNIIGGNVSDSIINNI